MGAIYIDLNSPSLRFLPLVNRAMAHELGHLLGLDHDLDKRSVMYYRAIDDPYKITEKDLSRIVNKYK